MLKVSFLSPYVQTIVGKLIKMALLFDRKFIQYAGIRIRSLLVVIGCRGDYAIINLVRVHLETIFLSVSEF